jgi:Kef-type K+ transport system membrane component KefB
MSAQEASMLLLLTVGAFLVPLLAERLGLFAAPCEVLYGAVIAALVPGVHAPGEFVAALSNFGLLLLLFLAGLEIDFGLILQQGGGILLRAGAVAVGIQLLAFGAGMLLHWPLLQVLLLGAMSVSVLLVMLRQEGVHGNAFGQILLIAGAIGEFLSILELTGYDLIHRHGFGWALALAALKLVALLVLGFIALRALRVAIVRRPHRFGRLVATHDPLEVGVRAALALMLCFAAVAVLLDVEQLLATFIAGLVCSFGFRGRNALTEKLMTLGQGFFLPIFFIAAGLSLQVGALLHGPALALLVALVLGVLLTRIVAIPLLRLAGLSWRQAGAGALLLAAPLTLQVAIVKVGIDLGELPESVQGVVLGAAIVGAFVFPLVARSMMHPPRLLPRLLDALGARWSREWLARRFGEHAPRVAVAMRRVVVRRVAVRIGVGIGGAGFEGAGFEGAGAGRVDFGDTWREGEGELPDDPTLEGLAGVGV